MHTALMIKTLNALRIYRRWKRGWDLSSKKAMHQSLHFVECQTTNVWMYECI